MDIKDFDIIRFDNSRTGTVVDTLYEGKAFLVEIYDENGMVVDEVVVEKERIQEVTYRHTKK